MKKSMKIALIAVVLMAFAGTMFSAVKDLNWYGKTKMSFDISAGWVDGLGVIADFDYALLHWSWGFGPINLKLGGFASIGYSFGYTVLGFGYAGGINLGVGPLVSVDWALGSVLPDVGFLNKLDFSIGVGVAYYFSSYYTYLAANHLGGYFPVAFVQIFNVKYHLSDTMALLLQETYMTWGSGVSFGVEFKF